MGTFNYRRYLYNSSGGSWQDSDIVTISDPNKSTYYPRIGQGIGYTTIGSAYGCYQTLPTSSVQYVSDGESKTVFFVANGYDVYYYKIYQVLRKNGSVYSTNLLSSGGGCRNSNNLPGYSLTPNFSVPAGYTFQGVSESSTTTTSYDYTGTNPSIYTSKTSFSSPQVFYYIYEANSYALRVYLYNGTNLKSNLYTYGDSVTLNSSIAPTMPTNFSLCGFSNSQNSTTIDYSIGSVMTIYRAATLYAIARFQVQYNPGSGSGSTVTRSYYNNTSTVSLSDQNGFYKSTTISSTINRTITKMAQDGTTFNTQSYTFNSGTRYSKIGWAYTSNATTANYTTTGTITIASVPTSYVSNGVLNLYPVYQGTNYSDTKQGTLTVTEDEQTRTGYKFLGYSETKDATTATYTPGNTYTLSLQNASITLYPVWKSSTIFYFGKDREWKECKLYYGVNGEWKEMEPFTVIGGKWK